MVSVITAAWRSDYLVQTAESILSPTYPNIEWIVTDEGIRGHTHRIQEIVDCVPRESRFSVVYLRNELPVGPQNLETGLKHANGIYVKWLDNDNLMGEGYLEALVPVMEAFPKIVLATTARDPINSKDEIEPNLVDLYRPILTRSFLASGEDILRACLTEAIPIQGTFNPLEEPSCALVRKVAIPDYSFQLNTTESRNPLFDFVLYLKLLLRSESIFYYYPKKLVSAEDIPLIPTKEVASAKFSASLVLISSYAKKQGYLKLNEKNRSPQNMD